MSKRSFDAVQKEQPEEDEQESLPTLDANVLTALLNVVRDAQCGEATLPADMTESIALGRSILLDMGLIAVPRCASCAAVSGNGMTFACALALTVFVFNMKDGSVVAKLALRSTITCVDISFDGNMVAAGDIHGRTSVWDVDTGEKMHVFKEESQKKVQSVKISSTKATIVSASVDGRISQWHCHDKKHIHRTGEIMTINALALSTDEKTIVYGGDKGRVYFWNTETDMCAYSDTADGTVTDIAFSLNERFIAVSHHPKGIFVYDRLGTFQHSIADDHRADSVAFSCDGRFVVSGGGDVTIWHADGSGKRKFLRFHEESIEHVAVLRGTNDIFSLSDDGIAIIWRNALRF